MTVITAFPEIFAGFIASSISGRAVSNGLVSVNIVNLRDFGRGNYRQLDDYAFGSGGMLFAAPQLTDALKSVAPGFVVYPSPQGVLISQEIIESLARQDHVIIICGHYEGIDERFTERYVDLEVTVGDCVLTGGEIPAMLIADAMSRLVPGVVGKAKAVVEDSFYRGMLDNPNYTRPADWEGLKVPDVLLGGNEREISRWRRREAVSRTLTRRPDLIARASIREYLSDKVGLALIADDEACDMSGVFELCEAYKLGRPCVVAGSKELRERVKSAYPGAKVFGSVKRLLEGSRDAMVVKVLGAAETNSLHSLEVKRRCLEHDGDIFFVFARDASRLRDIAGVACWLYEDDVAIPLNMKIGIALDRLLGVRS